MYFCRSQTKDIAGGTNAFSTHTQNPKTVTLRAHTSQKKSLASHCGRNYLTSKNKENIPVKKGILALTSLHSITKRYPKKKH